MELKKSSHFFRFIIVASRVKALAVFVEADDAIPQIFDFFEVSRRKVVPVLDKLAVFVGIAFPVKPKTGVDFFFIEQGRQEPVFDADQTFAGAGLAEDIFNFYVFI